MDEFSFGDIVDCKETFIKHFIVILGTDSQNHVLYKIITSRVYKAFNKLREFLDDCKNVVKCKEFEHAFNKEKDNDHLIQRVNLRDAFFLDQTYYSMLFTEDSMIMLNSDPEQIDLKTLNDWKAKKQITYRDTLSKADIYKLKLYLECSENISPAKLKVIHKSFNSKAKFIKEAEKKKAALKRNKCT